MIGAAAPASGGFNPLSIFTILETPFQFALQQLVNFYATVGPLKAIGAFGLAVMTLTIVIRGLLFPVFGWQLRTSRRIQAEQRLVAPQLQELRKKYKKEPQRLSQEMNALYKEHGISPFSSLTGCIPALVQMPVLIGLYQAIRAFTNTTPGHGVIPPGNSGFLWISNVTQTAQEACCTAAHNGFAGLLSQPQLLILPLLAGIFTFAQSRMMMPQSRPDMTDQERSMQGVTKQMSLIFPVMIFAFSFLFPQGLAIYWVTGTMFMVAQQYHLLGWNGLKVPSWFPGANRVTALTIPRTPAKTGAGSSKAALTAGNGKNPAGSTAKNGSGAAGKNGTKNSTAAASTNGAKPAADDDESVRSQSAQARSLARPGTRPNRPNRRRRRR
ncbi:MAG: YidC/Oxa1 family membrane protein insertase [Candidatus Dormiibacterota bacterium]